MINYSLDAEKALLGCILTKPDLFASVSFLIGLDDFYGAENRAVWDSIEFCAKHDTAIDVFTVSSSQGGTMLDYIINLASSTATTKNYASYCKVILDNSKKRKIHLAANEAINMLSTDSTVDEVQDALNEALAVTQSKTENKPLSAKEALISLVNRTDERYTNQEAPYKTGLKDLDESLKFDGGRLIVIAGRPAMGKSTLAQNICENNCAAGVSAYFATMEMAEEEVIGRMVSSQTGINTDFLTDPSGYEDEHSDIDDQWSKLTTGVNKIMDWPLAINFCPGLTVHKLKQDVRDHFSKQESYTKHGKGIIVIDYLGLMKTAGSNRVQEIGAITKELKTFAGEMKLPIIILVQLNRGLEQRPDKRPMMSDLRDSGEIEEDADAVLFVYRDEVYNPDTDQKGIAEIIISKNRMGKLGNIKVMSQLHRYKFTDAIAQNNY